MPKPNSMLTRIRTWLAETIQPYPDKGEAWCVKCVKSGWQTLVIPEQAIRTHVAAHKKNDHVRIITAFRRV